jgi:restriction system protein
MNISQVVAVMVVNPGLVLMLAALLFIVIASLTLRWQKNAGTRRHRRYQASAARALQFLATLPRDSQRINYLRKINPHVFEELMLLVLVRQGFTVVRNVAYRRNGGNDSQVIIDGEYWLIQARRYFRTVSQSHVSEFDCLLFQRSRRGLFIHTGLINNDICNASKRLHIINGQNLLAILSGQNIRDFI